MGSISDYLEDELLDHVFNAAWTAPSTVYLGLSTADPLDDASGIAEPGDTYARQAIEFNAAASRKVENTNLETFPQATGSWGTLTHWFVCDHVSNTTFGTNVELLAHGSFVTSKSVVSGNTPSVAAAEVDIEFSAGEIADYLVLALLDLAFRNQAYSAPDTYIALCTVNVTDSMTGSTITEPSGNNYARKQVNINGGSSPTWDLASGGALDNTHDVTFNVPSGSWGLCTAVAIVDALTVGNLLFYDNAITDQTPDNGDTVKFPIGDLDVTMS